MSFAFSPLAAGFAVLIGGACVVSVLMIRRHFALKYRLEYTLDFVERFRRYVTSLRAGQPDSGLLAWLAPRAERMQELMGPEGRIEYWSPEERLLERDFAVVRRTFGEISGGHPTEHLIAACQLALIRYLSALQERYR